MKRDNRRLLFVACMGIFGTVCLFAQREEISPPPINDKIFEDGLLIERRPPRDTLDIFSVIEDDTQDTTPFSVGDFDFFGIRFGDNLSIVEKKVSDLDFLVQRQKNSVSLLPPSRDSIFSTYGNYFIREALFQFDDNALKVINVSFDERIFSFYELYRSLQQKYLRPTDINPQKVVWDLTTIRITLEKPLSIRYQDTSDGPPPVFVPPRINKGDFLEQL